LIYMMQDIEPGGQLQILYQFINFSGQ